jgi:hypothetical protein
MRDATSWPLRLRFAMARGANKISRGSAPAR